MWKRHSQDIDNTHAAAQHLGVCNVLADHWAEMLGVEVQQVNRSWRHRSWRILKRIIATAPIIFLVPSLPTQPFLSVAQPKEPD
jgi:hypothetical protein